MAPHSRVLITGMGTVSALGVGSEASWAQLAGGKTAVAPLDLHDGTFYRATLGSRVDRDAIHAGVDALGVRPSDLTLDMTLVAGAEAIAEAGLDKAARAATPIDVIYGTGGGPAESAFDAARRFAERGPRGPRPTTIPRCMPNIIASRLPILFGLTGAHYVVASACSSAASAIAIAVERIRSGRSSIVICGGGDSPFDPITYAAWDNLRILSPETDPAKGCRPYDRSRNGFLLGEGAATFVLESDASAAGRGASILGEIGGVGETSDAAHLTRPEAGEQARAMTMAMEDAGLSPADLAFICGHGTATAISDAAEAEAITMALGEYVADVPVTALKGYLGHLLGGSAAVELWVTLMALRQNTIPPNITLSEPDPDIPLPHVTETTATDKRWALKNSFGFGGNNTVIAVGWSCMG